MIPDKIKPLADKLNISDLRPAQKKAIDAGLLDGNNLLVCTPTASGKTFIALMAMWFCKKKSLYVVPLKALASEKYNYFRGLGLKVAISVGDLDEADDNLLYADIIVLTAEKLDSLIRHKAPWLSSVGVLVLDEVHLLNDPSRGPVMEMLITLMRLVSNPQIIALSATIGNPKELADWLDAKLVVDNWRPCRLDQGIFFDGEVLFD